MHFSTFKAAFAVTTAALAVCFSSLSYSRFDSLACVSSCFLDLQGRHYRPQWPLEYALLSPLNACNYGGEMGNFNSGGGGGGCGVAYPAALLGTLRYLGTSKLRLVSGDFSPPLFINHNRYRLKNPAYTKSV